MYVCNLLIIEIMKMKASYAVMEFWKTSLEGICMWVASVFQAVMLHSTIPNWNRKAELFFRSSSEARGGKHRLDLYLTMTSFPLGIHVWTTTDIWPCGILWFPAHMWNLSKLWSLRMERVTGRLLSMEVEINSMIIAFPSFLHVYN